MDYLLFSIQIVPDLQKLISVTSQTQDNVLTIEAAFMVLLDRLYLDSPSEYLPVSERRNNLHET